MVDEIAASRGDLGAKLEALDRLGHLLGLLKDEKNVLVRWHCGLS